MTKTQSCSLHIAPKSFDSRPLCKHLDDVPVRAQVTRLDFAPEHAHSYNELIEVVKLNLLLADWNDEDHNESLLSVRNSKWGKEMLRNVR